MVCAGSSLLKLAVITVRWEVLGAWFWKARQPLVPMEGTIVCLFLLGRCDSPVRTVRWCLVLLLLHLTPQASCGQVWPDLPAESVLFGSAAVPSCFSTSSLMPQNSGLCFSVWSGVCSLAVSGTVCSVVKLTPRGCKADGELAPLLEN